MQGKLTLFVFLSAWIVYFTKVLINRADENGNIYIPGIKNIAELFLNISKHIKKFLKKQ